MGSELVVRKIVAAARREAIGHVLYGIGLVLCVAWFAGIAFLVADAWWPNDSLAAIVVKAVVGLVPGAVFGVIGGVVRDNASREIRMLTDQLTVEEDTSGPERPPPMFRFGAGPKGSMGTLASTAEAVQPPASPIPTTSSMAEPASEELPPPLIGRIPAMFAAGGTLSATTALLPNGIAFGRQVIPWSDVEKVITPGPGRLVFQIRSGHRTAELEAISMIEVRDLGTAESVWRNYISQRGLRAEEVGEH